MKMSLKQHVLIPVSIVIISLILIWLTGAVKVFRWCSIRDNIYIWMEMVKGADFEAIIYNRDIPYTKSLKYFVDKHPTNPEYQFGFALMKSNSKEFHKYLHKAQKIDHINPVYPYFLGLTYSNALIKANNEVNEDSALVAFSRAEKLEPDNAAIDLAKLNILIKQEDYLIDKSYIQKRDRILHDQSIENSIITKQAREAVQKAIEKPIYDSHASEAINLGLKLWIICNLVAKN